MKTPLRIGIDMTCVRPDKTGIGWHTFHLIKNAAALDRVNEYHLFGFRDLCEEMKQYTGSNFIYHEILPGPLKLIRLPLFFSQEIKRCNIGIFHCTYHNIPFPTGKIKIISTVHDLISHFFPNKFDMKHRFIYNIIYPHIIRRSDRIITVSNATKNDIIDIYNINNSKINIIYNAVDEHYRVLGDKSGIQGILNRFSIKQPYILYVGTLEPRKNLVRLIESYSVLRNKYKVTHKLVIAGKKGWLFGDIFKTVKQLALENEVIFTGYVSVEELLYLYNGASLFVYPSLYEGFGIPPLEAMKCGVPVISSNVSSLPEVLGNAALLVNPENTEELTESMYNIIFNSELKQKYIRQGFEQSSKYNWIDSAKQIISIYNSVGKD